MLYGRISERIRASYTPSKEAGKKAEPVRELATAGAGAPHPHRVDKAQAPYTVGSSLSIALGHSQPIAPGHDSEDATTYQSLGILIAFVQAYHEAWSGATLNFSLWGGGHGADRAYLHVKDKRVYTFRCRAGCAR